MFRNRAVRVCSVFSLAVMLALACGGCKKDKTPPGNPMAKMGFVMGGRPFQICDGMARNGVADVENIYPRPA